MAVRCYATEERLTRFRRLAGWCVSATVLAAGPKECGAGAKAPAAGGGGGFLIAHLPPVEGDGERAAGDHATILVIVEIGYAEADILEKARLSHRAAYSGLTVRLHHVELHLPKERVIQAQLPQHHPLGIDLPAVSEHPDEVDAAALRSGPPVHFMSPRRVDAIGEDIHLPAGDIIDLNAHRRSLCSLEADGRGAAERIWPAGGEGKRLPVRKQGRPVRTGAKGLDLSLEHAEHTTSQCTYNDLPIGHIERRYGNWRQSARSRVPGVHSVRLASPWRLV